MANPAAQARANAQKKWPGAVVAERGRGYIRHQHPSNPNRFMLDTQVGGKWHYGDGPFTESDEVDTAWQTSIGQWDYEVVKNDFHSFVRDTVPVSYRYEDVATGHWVELTVNAIQWVNDEGQSENAASFSQVTPTINDDEITWSNIAPGWHVLVRAETARLAKWLTIDSLASLGTPTIGGTNIRLRFQLTYQRSNGLEIWADGQQWNQQSNTWLSSVNEIEFRDETSQQPIFYFRRPLGIDNVGDPVSMSHRVRRQGNNYYAEIDTSWAWLQSANYPIELDDTIEPQVGASEFDAYEKDDDTTFSATGTIICNSNTAAGGRYNGEAIVTATGPASGDTVDVAYAIVYARPGVGSINVSIHCEDVDDAADFTTNADVTNRAITTASTTWNGSLNSHTTPTNSPSIVSAVQEIFDRGGWSSGNDLGVYLKGNSDTNVDTQLESYDVTASEALALHIEYTAGGGGSAPPRIRPLRFWKSRR